MDITGIGEAAQAAKGIIGMFFPDKTAEEQAQISAALAVLQSQTEIDKAEAQSSDPLQHWRGGLGWVCAFAYGWNFVGQPLIVAVSAIAGHPIPAAQLPQLDIGPLSTLTLGMLGLGGLHVAERIKGSAG